MYDTGNGIGAMNGQEGAMIVGWSGPGNPEKAGKRRWWRFLLAPVMPARGHRTVPTMAGYFLILIAIGLGMAAYNTSSNILFITLSLLLSSLILSGLLSWINFYGTCWRLLPQGPYRDGERGNILVEVWNQKKHLPTYDLHFSLMRRNEKEDEELSVRERVEAGERRKLEWLFVPGRRGLERIDLRAVSSKFPFGFLQKSLTAAVSTEIRVWPRRIEYQLKGEGGTLLRTQGRPLRRVGQGGDLLNLRAYRAGDSHRMVHWKASARLGKILVRQNAEENEPGFFLHVATTAGDWSRPEQFEILCRFAATLAEDLFQQNRLYGAAVNDEPVVHVRRLVDLERFLDRLALLEPGKNLRFSNAADSRNTITFQPGSALRVDALIAGRPVATA